MARSPVSATSFVFALALLSTILFVVHGGGSGSSREASLTHTQIQPSQPPQQIGARSADQDHLKNPLGELDSTIDDVRITPIADDDMISQVPASYSHATAEYTACEPRPYDFGAQDYCGAKYFTAATYPMPTPVAGQQWTLASLQLVTRHGDRTPVSVAPSYDVEFPFCGATASLGFYDQSSTQQGQTTTNGDKRVRKTRASDHEGRRLERQPYLTAPSVANPFGSQLWQGNCMTGQLTSKGIAQLEALGAALRSIYVDQLEFLPPTYTRANTSFYLRTTDVWRTRQSAESLLTGFWPASDLEADVIPLHSFPAEIETMYANTLACDALATVQAEQLASTTWLEHLKAPDVWPIVDEVMNIGGLIDWHASYDKLFDNFRVRQCHDLPLPCSKNDTSKCIPQSVADYVYAQGDWEYQYLLNTSPLATQSAQLGIGSFMSVIRDVIIATITGDPTVSSIGTPAFAYYSGHDTTIGAVLGALNVTGMAWPPYASNMQFELWRATPTKNSAAAREELDAAQGEYSVRILYNGVILPLYAAGCCDAMCPVEQFVSYLNTMIPEEIVSICQGDGVRKRLH